MKYAGMFACAIALVLSHAGACRAQLGLFTREQRIDITSAWKGDRFPDGRPRVSDSILQGMKTVSAEEAWGVLRGAHFSNQFTGGWKEFNSAAGRLVHLPGLHPSDPVSCCACTISPTGQASPCQSWLCASFFLTRRSMPS